MAAELVSGATSDKLTEFDWTKSIQICELVAKDHRYQLSLLFWNELIGLITC